MSGHSKWATTRHRKAAQDTKRSALFSKLSRAITVAAKEGGNPDPANNASLAAAIAKARSYSLPKDRIAVAIEKAFGATGDSSFEEVVYEGYGPAGVAFYVQALTDNRNRTAAAVRSVFARAGGNLASSGSVAFQFERKGEVLVEKVAMPDGEELLLAVVDAGAEDIEDDGDTFTVVTDHASLIAVHDAIESAGIALRGAQLVMRPTNVVSLDIPEAKKVVHLADALEEIDDVQEVFHNLELTDELLRALDE